jgi:hypothetical protein
MAVIHSLSPGFKNQVSGVGCQVSGERNVRAENQNLIFSRGILSRRSFVSLSEDGRPALLVFVWDLNFVA